MLGLLVPRASLRGLALLSSLLLAAAVIGCGSRATPPAQTSRGNLQSIFEAEPQLHADPASALQLLRRLGADRVRVYVPWNTIAPDAASSAPPTGFAATDPAAYPAGAWTIYDEIVRAAHTRGIGLDFTIGGPPPLWAAGRGAPRRRGPYPQWRPSASQYGAFVHALGTRYNGAYTPPGASSPLPRVRFWAIWNEPNYGPDLAPQAVDHSRIEVSPRLYRNLLDAAWEALRATGHSGDTILIGETAPRGVTTGNAPGNFQGMVPLRFLRALYCVDSSFRQLRGAAAGARGCPIDAAGSARFARAHPALFQASGFSDHPYPQGAVPPNVPALDEPDYADLPSLPKLEATLDRLLETYGSSRRLPIYSTEFGYQTDPPEKIARSVAPATAAYYLNWSEYISWRDPRVRSYDQYLLADPPGANALGGFATGIEFASGVPKATYDAYRMPLYLPVPTAGAGHGVEVWGGVRPAHYAQLQTRGRQRVQIQFQPGSRGAFKPLQTVTIIDPHGYFDIRAAFPSRGSVRLAWSYPHGPTIHSRVVNVTAS